MPFRLGEDSGTASSPAGQDFAMLNLIFCGTFLLRRIYEPPAADLQPSCGGFTTSPIVQRRF
jgi:hypothetical protein